MSMCNAKAAPLAERRGASLALALALGGCAISAARAQSDADETEKAPGFWSSLRGSAGVRLWNAQWDSWNVDRIGTGVAVGDDRYEVVESRRGNQRLAVIPNLSVRYDSFFLAASAMTTTRYTLNEAATPGSFSVRASRSEFDLNLGYSFPVGANLSLGGKQIKQRFGPDEYKWQGPVLGFSANAPLGGTRWGMYGSFGAGQLKAEFPRTDALKPTRFDADYRVADLGFAFTILAPARWVRALVFTVGYRSQRVATKSYPLFVTPSSTGGQPPRVNAMGTLVDTTQGFVIGITEAY
jgi:hypothetical protein